MSEEKIIFNITFHWQLPQLKWHLENIFSWSSSDNSEYVLVSAHKDNLTAINKWIRKKYKDKKVDYILLPTDHGNHLGCAMNVIEGLKYIRDNKDYDYVANVEADNQFRDEGKFLKLVKKLKENNKDMLLIDHENISWDGGPPGKKLLTRFDIKNQFHMTTLNIYTKNFIENYLPLEYNKKYMGFGWCGAPGTPFEPFFALSLIDKHKLKDENEILDFVEKHSYKLSYDQKLNPCNFAQPDDLTPDRYMKYGILNCPNARNSTGATEPDTWRAALRFTELYDPLKYDFE